MPNWTKAQIDAITARKGTVLVSAAAGSGKTAVLVERLIQRITDKEKPVDADKLLVVTFTKAAAAEMKERAEKAVSKELKKSPNDKHLQRQQMLIHQMNVSTIDSFCSKLCKDYFYKLDIVPDFKIVSEKQRAELVEQAISKVLFDKLANDDYVLNDAFSAERNDRKLYSTISNLYNYASSHLSAEKWLDQKAEMYSTKQNVEDTQWAKSVINHATEVVNFCISLTDYSLKELNDEPVDQILLEKYQPTFEDDNKVLANFTDVFSSGTWDEMRGTIEKPPWKRFGVLPRGKYTDDPLKIKLADRRDLVKKNIKDLKKLFMYDKVQSLQDIEDSKEIVQNLVETTKEFGKEFIRLKKEKKFLDYGDLEHLAIALLLGENDKGEIVPSEIALQISDRFEEIMIDEYQDTNEVQDWIFRAISKADNNKFMVGDVKQCIYSFRQAMPEIFIGYKDKFRLYDKAEQQYPAKVVLDKNFRSREEVIDSVNNVFTLLMSKGCGGVSYNNEEALTHGASYYPDGKGFETRVDFLEKFAKDKETGEAIHIANMIKDMMNSAFKVSDDDGFRKPKFSDFCVLLRSTKKSASIYSSVLEENGVPSWSETTLGFFGKKEIMQIISFLQIINNPNQDIPLLSVLMGPVYGFTPDDMAQLRNASSGSLYLAMTKNSISVGDDNKHCEELKKAQEKFQTFLNDIKNFRFMAAHMPTDLFLDKFFMETSFEDIVLAMENGEERLANVRQFRSYAADFESSGYVGVSGFVRFIENMKRNRGDMESANLASDKADVVKIMSIHKSKGLEFPVCIVAGLDKQGVNVADDLVLNSQLGIAIKLTDKSSGYKFNNLMSDSIIMENKMQRMSEELRVLYVAMTRAKEKLIMVSTFRNIESTVKSLKNFLTIGDKIEPYAVKSAKSMAQWMMLCCLKHSSGTELRKMLEIEDAVISRKNFSPWEINVFPNGTIKLPETKESEKQVQFKADEALASEIKAKMEYKYPNTILNQIPAKVSASIVAHENSERFISLTAPTFMSKKGMTGATRGTAVHNFIEYCDFKNALENTEEEVKRVVEQGFITKEQGEAVDRQKLKTFLKSNLGQRIINAKEVFRELKFFANIKASLVNKDYPDDVKVSMQGAVDCAFVENDKLFIVDFKTDKIKKAEIFKEEYSKQLELYAHALKEVKNMEIGACALYSFYLDEEIELDNVL